MKIFTVFFAVVALSVGAATELRAGSSAMDAWRALPAKFRDGVLSVTTTNADASPRLWTFIAVNTEDSRLPVQFQVTDGHVVRRFPSFNPRPLLTGASRINRHRIGVDSADIWRIANSYANEQGVRLASMKLLLEQKGRNATPVWSVWMYDRRGNHIGFLSLLATNGSILRRG